MLAAVLNAIPHVFPAVIQQHPAVRPALPTLLLRVHSRLHVNVELAISESLMLAIVFSAILSV